MVQSCGAIITAEEGDVNLLFLPSPIRLRVSKRLGRILV